MSKVLPSAILLVAIVLQNGLIGGAAVVPKSRYQFTLQGASYSVATFSISASGSRQEVPYDTIIPYGQSSSTVLYLSGIEIAGEEVTITSSGPEISRYILKGANKVRVLGPKLIEDAYIKNVRFLTLADGSRQEVSSGGLIPSNFGSTSILYIVLQAGNRQALWQDEYSSSGTANRYKFNIKEATKAILGKEQHSTASQFEAVRYIVSKDGSRKEVTTRTSVPRNAETLTILFSGSGENRKAVQEEVYLPGALYTVTRRYSVNPADQTRNKIAEETVVASTTVTKRFLELPKGEQREVEAGEFVPSDKLSVTKVKLLKLDGSSKAISEEEYQPPPLNDKSASGSHRVYLLPSEGPKYLVANENVPQIKTVVNIVTTIYILNADGTRTEVGSKDTIPSTKSSVIVKSLVESDGKQQILSEEELKVGQGYINSIRYFVLPDGVTRTKASDDIIPGTNLAITRYTIANGKKFQTVTDLNAPYDKMKTTVTIRDIVNADGSRTAFSEENVIPGRTALTIRYFLVLPNGERKLVSDQTTPSTTFTQRFLLEDGQKVQMRPNDIAPVTASTKTTLYLIMSNGTQIDVADEDLIPKGMSSYNNQQYYLVGGTSKFLSQVIVPRYVTTTAMYLVNMILPDQTVRLVTGGELIPTSYKTVTVLTYTLADGNKKRVCEEEYIPGNGQTTLRRTVIDWLKRPQIAHEEVIKSTDRVVVVRYVLLKDGVSRRELSPREVISSSSTVINVVYLENPQGDLQVYSEEEFIFTETLTTTRHYTITNGQKTPGPDKVIPIAPQSKTVVEIYTIDSNGQRTKVPTGQSPPANTQLVYVISIISMEDNSKKPISEEEIIPGSDSTIVYLYTILPDGTRRRISKQVIPSTSVTIIRYVENPDNSRHEVQAEEPIDSTSTMVQVIYEIAPGKRTPLYEDEYAITTEVINIHRYTVIYEEETEKYIRDEQEVVEDIIPFVKVETKVIRYTVDRSGEKQELAPGQKIPENTQVITVIHLVKEDKDFSWEEVTPTLTEITEIRWIFLPDASKQEIGRYIEKIEDDRETITIEYIILDNGDRKPLGPNEKAPTGSHTVIVVYVLLKDGTKKPVSEIERIPSKTTTTIVLYIYRPDDSKKEVTRQVIETTTTEIVRLVSNKDGTREEVKPDEPVPASSTTIFVTYIVEEDKITPYSEDELVLTFTDTKVTRYLIVENEREQVSADIVPYYTKKIRVVRYLILEDGSRKEITLDEKVPKESETLEILYVVEEGNEREFTEEEVTYSEKTITTVRYSITLETPNESQRKEISREVAKVVESSKTITVIYTELENGARKEVESPKDIPEGSTVIYVVYVIKDGERKPSTETHLIPGITYTTSIIYTVYGTEKREVTRQIIPSRTVVVVRYIEGPDGQREEIEPSQPVPSTTKVITVTYIVKRDNSRVEYTEDEYQFDTTTKSRTIVRFVIINNDRKEVSRDVGPSVYTETVIVRYIVIDGVEKEVGPSELEPTSSTYEYKTVIYVVVDGNKEEFSKETIKTTEITKTIIRYIVVDGKPEKISQETRDIVEELETIEVIYIVTPGSSDKQELRPGQDVPEGTTRIVVVYVILPGGERKPVTETHIIPGETYTKVIVYTVTDTVTRKVTERHIPGKIRIITFIEDNEGGRTEVTPGSKVPGTYTIISITETIIGDIVERWSETTVELGPSTTVITYNTKDGESVEDGRDVLPLVTREIVFVSYVEINGERHEVQPDENVPRDATVITIVYVYTTDHKKEEFSEEVVTTVDEITTTIRYINVNHEKVKIYEDKHNPVDDWETIEITYIIIDGKRVPVGPNDVGTNNKDRVVVIYVILPSGERKPVQETEITITETTTIVTYYTIIEEVRREVKKHFVPSTTVVIYEFIVETDGTRKKVTPGDKVPAGSKIIQVTYIVTDTTEVEYSEVEVDFTSTTTTVITYIYKDGKSTEDSRDVIPSVIREVTTVITIIEYNGNKYVLQPNEKVPEDYAEKITIVYVVHHGKKEEFSSETVTVTEEEIIKTIRVIYVNGEKVTIYEDKHNPVDEWETIEITYIIVDGKRVPVGPNDVGTNNKDRVIVIYVILPGGEKKPVQETEITVTETTTIVTYYTVIEEIRREVSKHNVPSSTVVIYEFIVETDGTRNKVTPGDRVPAGSKIVQVTYIVTETEEVEYSEVEVDFTSTTTTVITYIYKDGKSTEDSRDVIPSVIREVITVITIIDENGEEHELQPNEKVPEDYVKKTTIVYIIRHGKKEEFSSETVTVTEEEITETIRVIYVHGEKVTIYEDKHNPVDEWETIEITYIIVDGKRVPVGPNDVGTNNKDRVIVIYVILPGGERKPVQETEITVTETTTIVTYYTIIEEVRREVKKHNVPSTTVVIYEFIVETDGTRNKVTPGDRVPAGSKIVQVTYIVTETEEVEYSEVEVDFTSTTTTVITYIYKDGKSTEDSRDVIPSVIREVITVITIIDENGDKHELQPNEKVPDEYVEKITVVYIIKHGKNEEFSSETVTVTEEEITETIRVIYVHGEKVTIYEDKHNPVDEWETIEITYIIVDGKRVPVGPNDVGTNNKDRVVVIYVILPGGERKPVQETEITIKETTTIVTYYTIIEEVRREVKKHNVPSTTVVIYEFIVETDGTRKKVTPGDKVPAGSKIVQVTYIVTETEEVEYSEVEVDFTSTTTTVITYIYKDGKSTEDSRDVIPSVIREVITVITIIDENGDKHELQPNEKVPDEYVEKITVVYIIKHGQREEFSTEEITVTEENIIEIVRIIYKNGEKVTIYEDKHNPVDEWETIEITYIIIDGKRVPVGPNEIVPKDKDRVIVVYVILPDGRRKPVEETEITVEETTTTITYYTVIEETRTVVKKHEVPSNTVVIIEYIVNKDGTRTKVTPGDRVPAGDKTVRVVYIITETEEVEYSEVEIDFTSTTTTVITYIYKNGYPKEDGRDVIPSVKSEVITIIYVVDEQGIKHELQPNEKQPEEGTVITIVYITHQGKREEFSETEVTTTEEEVTTIRYIYINHEKTQINTEVVETVDLVYTEKTTYLIIDGQRVPLKPGEKIPDGAHYIVVIEVVYPTGPRKPVQETEVEVIDEITKETTWVYIGPERVVVKERDIPSTKVVIIEYIVNKDNTRTPIKPGQKVPASTKIVQVTYIVTETDELTEYSETEIDFTTTTIITYIIEDTKPKEDGRVVVPIFNKEVVTIEYIEVNGERVELKPGEDKPKYGTIITIVYVVKDGKRIVWTEEDRTTTDEEITIIRYKYVNEEKVITWQENTKVIDQTSIYTVIYTVTDDDKRVPLVPGGKTDHQVTVIYVRMPNGEIKEITEEEINTKDSVTKYTVYGILEGELRKIKDREIPSTNYVVVYYIVNKDGSRTEVAPGKKVPATSKFLSVVYIVTESGERQEYSETEIVITSKTVIKTFVFENGKKKKDGQDYLPGPTMRVVQVKYVITEDGTRKEVPLDQDVPEGASYVVVVYRLTTDNKREEFSEESVTLTDTTTVTERFLLTTGKKQLFYKEVIQRIVVQKQHQLYIVIDGVRKEVQPGENVPETAETVEVTFILLPSGDKKILEEEEKIPGKEVTIIRKYRILDDGSREKYFEKRITHKTVITHKTYVIGPDGQPHEVSEADLPTYLSGGTITIQKHTYKLGPNGEQIEVPSEEVQTGGTTVEKHTYIIGPNGERIEVNKQDIENGSGTNVEKHTYVIGPNGERVEVNGNGGSTSTTHVEKHTYRIGPNGEKIEVTGKDLEDLKNGGESTTQIEKHTYRIGPNGERIEVTGNEGESTSTTQVEKHTYRIGPNGEKIEVTGKDLEDLKNGGGSTTQVEKHTYRIGPNGERIEVTGNEGESTSTTKVEKHTYRIGPNGEKIEVTGKDLEDLKNGGGSTTQVEKHTYRIGPNGERIEVTGNEGESTSTTKVEKHTYRIGPNGEKIEVTGKDLEDLKNGGGSTTQVEKHTYRIGPNGERIEVTGNEGESTSTTKVEKHTYRIGPNGEKIEVTGNDRENLVNGGGSTQVEKHTYRIGPNGEKIEVTGNEGGSTSTNQVERHTYRIGPNGEKIEVNGNDRERLVNGGGSTTNVVKHTYQIGPNGEKIEVPSNGGGSTSQVERHTYQIGPNGEKIEVSSNGGGSTSHVEKHTYRIGPNGEKIEANGNDLEGLVNGGGSTSHVERHTYQIGPNGEKIEVSGNGGGSSSSSTVEKHTYTIGPNGEKIELSGNELPNTGGGSTVESHTYTIGPNGEKIEVNNNNAGFISGGSSTNVQRHTYTIGPNGERIEVPNGEFANLRGGGGSSSTNTIVSNGGGEFSQSDLMKMLNGNSGSSTSVITQGA